MVSLLRQQRPDVVILSTTPPLAQLLIVIGSRLSGLPVVIWLQDLFGPAVASDGRTALGRLAGVVSTTTSTLEWAGLRLAHHVVAISDAFIPFLQRVGIPESRVTVIPNWAATTALAPGKKANPWSEAQGLADVPVVLYAGTLGYKHDWRALLELARSLQSSDSRLVVVSEGEFVEELRSAAEAENIDALTVLPFQPFEVLPDVLATADVCLALLTDDASTYSVPSKVQSYLAAGRPVLLGGSSAGDAAQAVLNAGAGEVVDAGNHAGLAEAAHHLLHQSGECGKRAHSFAQEAFDVRGKADQFETVLRDVTAEAAS